MLGGVASGLCEMKILVRKDGHRRVIISGGDGLFTFAEEKLVTSCFHEPCWIPAAHARTSLPICDSEETAEREARGRIQWLADEGEISE
jgi:hypothetical protein